jgi:hypothetical protein
LALVQAQWGRPERARQLLSKSGKPRVRMSDFIILLAASADEPEMALANIRLNPYYRNYRFLVTEPGLKPLYGDGAFQQLLRDTYPDWVRLLSEQREILVAPPPNLPSPQEFIKANGMQAGPNGTKGTD